MPTSWRDGATRQVFNASLDGGSFTGGPPKAVVHCTETGTWPGYSGGATAPHETWKWRGPTRRGFDVRAHIPHTRAARAMRNESGGVQTNRDSAHQIELVGSCDAGFARKYGYPHLPSLGDDFLEDLGRELRRFCEETGVPLRPVETWQAYPGSYGKRGGTSKVRMSLSQWDNFTGICGHQHVAENLHGDPGDVDIARALRLSVPEVETVRAPDPVKPVTSGQGDAPPFPLPPGHYFGPKDGPAESHSGYYGANDRKWLREWQAQMRARGYDIAVDGLYGDGTAHVCEVFQSRVGFKVTARIGPGIWKLAWEAKLGVGT